MDHAAHHVWAVLEPASLTVSSAYQMPTVPPIEHASVNRTGVERTAQFIPDHVTIFVSVVMDQMHVIASHALRMPARTSMETVSAISAGVVTTAKSTVESVTRCAELPDV